MRYDPRLVQPMRDELVRIGFEELMAPDEVDQLMAKQDPSLLVVVNSVCGCAAGKARPGVAMALKHQTVPDRLATVFAGMEMEAVERVRSHFHGYPPSSPQIALFKKGKLVYMLERHQIEGRDASQIATLLTKAFDQHCTEAA